MIHINPESPPEGGDDMSLRSNDVGSAIVGEETAVRVLLFNKKSEILLQQVNIPNKPKFYITPGGRLNSPEEDLVSAVRRELNEETGLDNFSIISDLPIFSGSHVMRKKQGLVRMTEHFFVVNLQDDIDTINEQRQSLTLEEQEVFNGQKWFNLSELREGGVIVVPVNLSEVVAALLSNSHVPTIDFRDPPEFLK